MPRLTKAVSGKAIIVDNPAADKVFLNDALENFRRAGVVPSAIWVNDSDGSAHANPKAVGLGAVYFRFGANEAKLLEPGFQKCPRLDATDPITALSFRLVGAKEYVALDFFEP